MSIVEPAEMLSTIVEFSIGLAGFSGVIGIFIHRSGEWMYVDRFRITNLLTMSLTPGFLAFLTLGLAYLYAEIDTATRISAAVFAMVLAGLLTIIPRARTRVPEQDKHLVGPMIFVPMASTFAIVMLLQGLVAFSVIEVHQYVIYYYCLVVMLLLAVVQFARLILARPVRSEDASTASSSDGV